MQAAELPAPLALLLGADLGGPGQGDGKDLPQGRVLEIGLAGEVLEIGVGAYAQGYAPQRSQTPSSESP